MARRRVRRFWDAHTSLTYLPWMGFGAVVLVFANHLRSKLYSRTAYFGTLKSGTRNDLLPIVAMASTALHNQNPSVAGDMEHAPLHTVLHTMVDGGEEGSSKNSAELSVTAPPPAPIDVQIATAAPLSVAPAPIDVPIATAAPLSVAPAPIDVPIATAAPLSIAADVLSAPHQAAPLSAASDVSTALHQVLVKPSIEPYRLQHYGVGSSSQDAQDLFVDTYLGQLTNGFVVEGGAYNGEFASNSLMLEKHRHWSCLLVEANPALQQQILERHRKCHLLKGGFSPTNSTSTFSFRMGGVVGGIVDHYSQNPAFKQRLDAFIDSNKANLPEYSGDLVEARCFPLHMLAQHLGRTTVDYWSLDTEGSEAEIVEGTDFTQIEVGMITVEHNYEAEKRERIRERLESQAFVRVMRSLGEDDVYANPCYFVRRSLPFPYPDPPWSLIPHVPLKPKFLDAQEFSKAVTPYGDSARIQQLKASIVNPSSDSYKFEKYRVGVDTYVSLHGQDSWVDDVTAHSIGLFAVEMGSSNGEDGSDTLWLETSRKWDCLLVHSDASSQGVALEKHRKCGSLLAGFCVGEHTSSGCYSMFEILQALSRKTVDYWSLDVQGKGSALAILQSTDFAQVEVGLLTVRTYDAEVLQITDHMEQNGFSAIHVEQDGVTRVAFFANPCYLAKHRLPWPKRDERACKALFQGHGSECGAGVSASAPDIVVQGTGKNVQSDGNRFLITSTHSGVSNEMAFLSAQLGVPAHIGPFCAEAAESHPRPCMPEIFNRDRIDAIWSNQALAAQLKGYDGVIVTAGKLAAYPFFTSSAFEKKPIILWVGLVERFDSRTMAWAVPNYEVNAYEEVFMKASCCRKNVHIIAASEAELELAQREHSPFLKSERWRVIRPIGHESAWFEKSVKVDLKQDIDLNAAPFQSEKLCVFQMNYKLVKDYIEPSESHIIFPRAYGGPRGLRAMCRATVIFPDGPTSMAIWENGQMGNVMLLPAPELLLTLMREKQTKDLMRFPHTLDFLTQRTEWYRPANRPLFVFFDSLAKLKATFMSIEFESQRQAMRTFMDSHEAEQLSKWREVFAEIAPEQ